MLSIPPISANPCLYKLEIPKEPEISRIGEFSLDGKNAMVNRERTSARFLLKEYDSVVPDTSLDLRHVGLCEIKATKTDNLKHIQKWIVRNSKVGESLTQAVNVDFITNGSLVRKLATSPYEVGIGEDTGIKLVCCKFENVIFMGEFPTKASDQLNQDIWKDLERKMVENYSRSFLHVISKPKEISSSSANNEFHAIFGARFGKNKVLYTNAIDSLSADGRHYVEVKTLLHGVKKTQQGKSGRFIGKKMLRWWMQAFLTTANYLTIGNRDSQGIVRKVIFGNK
ncbi:RAI1 like PD-(D/E)XK nuclease domain-containing protein [Ditylenchus destructor]|uniref:Decapping nuclease n=1 Tax=Ditylenchus destructor TaxID=166010 RepID=A0AAD4NJC3_9BILA|nr:RAI1 like PD-(D/E)XK nuclease domain-containing protein [Ditylenchus destructor]